MDPRDFLSLTGFGSLGSVLLGLGILGCLLHRNSSRLIASAFVALTGSLLLLDGAQLFHAVRPAVPVSLAVLIAGTAVFFFLRTGERTDRDLTADQVNPSATAAKLAENGTESTKTAP